MIRVENLSKIFNIHILDNKVINAFRDISFHVKNGEFLGLSGPSGSGKSTILKCIYRTYLSSGGNIWFNSAEYGVINIATAPNHAILNIRKREVGYVSQFLKVIPRVPAVDIVAEPLVTKNGLTPNKARTRAGELLERLDIPTYLVDAYPCSFSGGEQQRVNIARAVIWAPRLLLLDEPTASLDMASMAVVIDLLKELKYEGTTMIGIFHDSVILDSVTDKTYAMKQGVTNHHAA